MGFTFIEPAGKFVQPSQILADRVCASFAENDARQHRICLSELVPSTVLLGANYSATITATGFFLSSGSGFQNVWEIVGGALPPGILLNNGSVFALKSVSVTGKATQSGVFNFVLRITAPNGDYFVKPYALTVTTQPVPLDMPLDQACYDPVRDVIFGVRGGYIQEYSNAGVPTSNRTRYVVPAFGESSIAYDSLTDRIFVLFWNDPNGLSYPYGVQGIYKINPSTLGTEARFDLNALASVDPGNSDFRPRLIARGGVLYGTLSADNSVQFSCRTDGASATGNFFSTASGWQGLEKNGTEIWIGAPNGIGQNIIFLDSANMNFIASANLGIGAWDVAVNTTNGRGYCTTRSPVIKRISAAHAILADLNLPNPSAKPFCIRYNSNDNKIYCPDETTQTVYIIDGATEAITAQTGGFDSPFDMVFTPTKKFTVQHGLVGLKEVL